MFLSEIFEIRCDRQEMIKTTYSVQGTGKPRDCIQCDKPATLTKKMFLLKIHTNIYL